MAAEREAARLHLLESGNAHPRHRDVDATVARIVDAVHARAPAPSAPELEAVGPGMKLRLAGLPPWTIVVVLGFALAALIVVGFGRGWFR